MHEVLDEVTLKSGERMAILAVRGPDDEYAERKMAFLQARGFEREAVLRQQARQGETSVGIVLFCKFGQFACQ